MTRGSSRWRDAARPIIRQVIESSPHDEKIVRANLRAAYPFGEREMWPYKCWCREVKEQLKRAGFPQLTKAQKRQAPDPMQDKLL